MIDNSFFSSQMPPMDYNIEPLKLDGYKLEYSLDSSDKQLQEIITNYKQNRVPVKIIENQHGKTHIWVQTRPEDSAQEVKKCPRCNTKDVIHTGNSLGYNSSLALVTHNVDEYFEFNCCNQKCLKKSFWVIKGVHTF